MALWYDCGNGFVTTRWAKKHIGSDCYLCCPGPSLKNISNSYFARPNVTVFAINTAYPRIRPHYWIGMDRVECYDYQLWWESFPKICRGGYQDMKCCGTPVKDLSNVYFADVDASAHRNQTFYRRAHDVKFVWQKNTLAVALHIMIWMGAKKIHFIGCDFRGEYYDGRPLSKDLQQSNQRLYTQQIDYLKWFSETGKTHGVECVSCTPDSPINMYLPYVPVKDALIASEQTPKNLPPSELMHAEEAETLYRKQVYATMFDTSADDEIYQGDSLFVAEDVEIGGKKDEPRLEKEKITYGRPAGTTN